MARPIDPAPDADDTDDEALRWAGDEEQGRARPLLAASEDDEPAVASLEAAGVDEDAHDERLRAPRDVAGTVAAILFGIVYLALTVGWIYSVQLMTAPSTNVFAEVVWQFGEFTAMVAAPIWFAAVTASTRGRAGARVGWFAIGLAVLLPWPVILELIG